MQDIVDQFIEIIILILNVEMSPKKYKTNGYEAIK
jgi:hypothetical protein